MKKIVILLAAITGMHANAQWNLTGNAGTTPGTNFIGTTDNQSLVFKTNNTEKMRINPEGRFIFHNIASAGQVWDKNLYFGGGMDNSPTSNNAVFGMGALTQLTVGGGNLALGNNALSLFSNGSFNVAVGFNSMRNSVSGNYNTALGMNALEYFQTGNSNVAVGISAMGSGSLSGDFNTALGASALRYINSGHYNTIIGGDSFRALANGSDNINVGYSNAKVITSGSGNIFIGNLITPYNTTSPEKELNIGNWIVGNNGTIGIGQFTTQLPTNGISTDGQKYKLFVKDGIRTEKVKVDIAASNGWADYVFEKDYQLMPLNDLAQFINKNGHLPEVPTTEEAIKNGIELKEMNILLLKKVEELTLHLIDQNKELKTQKEEIEALKSKVNSL
ncbi:hypothetical protein C1637_20630 [Chryseobacterium lactis]|uniref:Peptidase S74 domain-containing protein n=1 Tax=Chryseobacterium lactis TaxID=1241981 RepID=A0A3G6RDZ2_CHRLC|nr:hypothetical protein [Chryseobacterium lactis]AZA82653.1 hypothetical protein EG342_12530 [Chryseobacterium lactis]AZB03035.1 hypothetical protein EG341_03395 [Chryseobacterium lactis]PNW11826.1 hypothetical protein C1637_20630 [Chryseobacterium lactis]